MSDPMIDDGQAESVSFASPMEQEEAEPQVGPDETALIKRFERENHRPKDIKAIVDGMPGEREYVHTEANLSDQPGGVATNYILRYQWIHQAQVYAKDPSVSVRPRKRLGIMVPAVQQVLQDFAKSVEYLVQHFAKVGRLRPILDGMIQDADTVGIIFLKVNWIEDMDRDPTGTYRPASLKKSLRKLKRLQDDLAAGKFGEDDADYHELITVGLEVQKQQEAEYWRKIAYPTQQVVMGPNGMPTTGDGGLPALADITYPPDADPRLLRWNGAPTKPQIEELPAYRGFVFDPFNAEDVWWDWRITKPELLHRGEHITTRVWKTAAKIREDYGLAPDDTDSLPGSGDQRAQEMESDQREQRNDSDTADADVAESNGCYAVMERQQADGQIFTWVQGAKKFLRQESQDVVTSFRYNIFPVYFNRVSGRVLPISNTTLGKPLQDEINTVRTHKRQAKRAAYDRYITEQDLFDETDMDNLERCKPNGFTSTKKPIEDIQKGIYRMPGQYNEEVHSVIEERQELSSILGQSQASQGITRGGSDSATEAAIANQTAGSMADRHKDQLTFTYGDIFTHMAEVLIQALPEDNARAIGGPGTLWPMIDREALWQNLELDIEAGSTGKPDQAKRMDTLQQAMQIGQAVGIGVDPMQPKWNAVKVLGKLGDIMDWREAPEDLLIMPALPPMPGPLPPPGPLGGGGGGAPPSDGLPQGPNSGQEIGAEMQAPVQEGPTLPMMQHAPEMGAMR